MGKYNFDKPVNRKNTRCSKWDEIQEVFNRDDIIPLWVADTDFEVADEIKEAIVKRANHSVFGYAIEDDKLYKSVMLWMEKRHNLSINKEWILFTTGVVPAVKYAINAFTDEGDNIIIQTPVYHSFLSAIRNNKRNVIENPLKIVNGKYEMDFDNLEDLLQYNPKLFILCNPQNPSGRVWTKEELLKLGEFCFKNNILLVSDDIHSDIIYKGYKYTSMLELTEEIKNNLIVCYAPSKTFNIAGLATSAIIIPNEKIREKYNKFKIRVAPELNIFGIEAMTAAYNYGEEWLEEVLSYLEGNIDYMEKYFKENLPMINFMRPESTFLAWIDFSGLKLNDEELNEFLINNARVGLNKGISFGQNGKGYMRLNFGTQRENIIKAMEQIKKAVDETKILI